MSYSVQSRNVRFCPGWRRACARVISIPWGVALLGKIQGRCDGAGSEVIGGKPSVNRALRGYPPRVLLLTLISPLLGWRLGAEALNRESAKPPGRFCPAFLLAAAALSQQLRLGAGTFRCLPDLG